MSIAEEAKVIDEIRNYLFEHKFVSQTSQLKEDTPLMTSGLLDSFSSFGLISMLEDKYEIELSVTDTLPENFDTIKSIASIVVSKCADKQA